MKKANFILVILIVLNISSVFGQITVGVKANPIFGNASRILGDYGNQTFGTTQDDYSGIMALPSVGISLGYELNRYWEVKTELFYGFQGIKQTKEPFENIYISYIELPVLFQWKTNTKLSWFVNSGAVIKARLKAVNSYHLPNKKNKTITKETNVNESFHPFVLALSLGTGITYPFTEKIYLSAEWRWSYDITQVAKKGSNLTLSNNKWYFNNSHILHANLFVGVHYRF